MVYNVVYKLTDAVQIQMQATGNKQKQPTGSQTSKEKAKRNIALKYNRDTPAPNN